MTTKAVGISTNVDPQQNAGPFPHVHFCYNDKKTTEIFNKNLNLPMETTLTFAGFVTRPSVIRHSYLKFNQWITANQETGGVKEFEQLHDHPLLKKFLDPKAHKLMLDPMRTPAGETFNRQTLITLSQLRPDDGLIFDSSSTICFTLQQVEDDYELLAKLSATYTKLLMGEINPSPAVKQGLEILIKELEEDVNNFVSEEMLILTKDLKLKKITRDQFADKTFELLSKANPSV